MIILGEKELKSEKISVRKKGKEDLGSMSCKNFCEYIEREIKKELEV